MSSKNFDDIPEDILSHILSLMPMKNAVRTSILSKRWRYSWMYVTNLDFDDIHPVDGFDSFSEFMDRVPEVCKTSNVKLFRLHLCKSRARISSNISNWIDNAVRLNVSELDIRVFLLEMPSSFFTCKTLTSLRLDYISWKYSCPVDLPCLKTLDIVVDVAPFVNTFKLISGCPLLESLSLEVECCDGEEDYLFNIPTLKRLKLSLLDCSENFNIVYLNVPNLEYLFLGGMLCSFFEMEDVSSLVKACVSVTEIRCNHLWFEILKGTKGVESLSAHNGSSLIDFKIPFTCPLIFTRPLPTFLNIKQLELKGFWYFGLIPRLLESCPELKHLHIEKLEESYWVEPKLVPTCMLSNLTTIQFSKCKGKKWDIEFLEYILGNAEVLKTVTIGWENSRVDEDLRLYAKLVKLPRASRSCEIHFLEN